MTSNNQNSLDKMEQIINTVNQNPAESIQTKKQYIELLTLLKQKITFEYDMEIKKKEQKKETLINFYSKAQARLNKIPKDITGIPAVQLLSDDFEFKNRIMFGEINVGDTCLDKDYINQCTKKIVELERNKNKKIDEVKKDTKTTDDRSFYSRSDRNETKLFNRFNGIYSNSASKKIGMCNLSKNTRCLTPNTKKAPNYELRKDFGSKGISKTKGKAINFNPYVDKVTHREFFSSSTNITNKPRILKLN